MKQTVKPVRERKPILNDDDFYWEIGDDGEDDGFLHIVCTIDGSEIKIPLKGLK